MIPFFVEKLWDLRPHLNLEITSPSSQSIESIRLRHEIYESYGQFLTIESANVINKRNLMFGSSHGNYNCMCNYSARFHEDIYKMDTLDGSDYYICKHGKRIR